MSTQYPERRLYKSAKYPYTNGRSALPQSPIIITEAPSFVNRPNPSSASGHMPAHTIELAKPNKTKNHIEISAVCPNNVTVLAA